jgi:hypothetical protein
MDSLLSSLAYADALHDFKNVAKIYKNKIINSLPGLVHQISDEETLIKMAKIRFGEFKPLDVSSPDGAYNQLSKKRKPFGILSDALFGKPLVDLLAKNTIGHYYLINNIENRNDPGYQIEIDNPKCIIIDDMMDNTLISQYYRWDDSINYNTKLCSKYPIHLKYNESLEPNMYIYNKDDVEFFYDNLKYRNSDAIYRLNGSAN